MPRNDAARWRRKVDSIIKSTLHPHDNERHTRDDDYHRRVLEKIQAEREAEEE